MNEERSGEMPVSPYSKEPTMEVKNVIGALVKAQLKIVPPKKQGTNPMFKNRYMTYEAIMDAVRLPLAESGLTLWHTIAGEFLLTRLYHVSGEYLENLFPMKVERQNSQGVASANTYAKRQAICNMIGLSGDDDDDGNEACQEKVEEKKMKISLEQQEVLEEYIGADPKVIERILDRYKVKNLADLDSMHFSPVLNGLKKMREKPNENR